MIESKCSSAVARNKNSICMMCCQTAHAAAGSVQLLFTADAAALLSLLQHVLWHISPSSCLLW
jgi:hypothetical protein